MKSPSPLLWVLLFVLLGAGLTMDFVGCGTPTQTTAFQTLSTVETTASGLYSGYLALVVQGKVRTNDVPIVSHAYNQLQADIVLAAVTLHNGTNAFAPAAIVQEAGALSTAIQTAEAIKP